MGRSELEPITTNYLLGRAQQILVQKKRLTSESAEEYLYELAQARKLLLTDAAAQVIAEGTTAPVSQSAFEGPTDGCGIVGGHEIDGGCEGVDWEPVRVPYWGTRESTS